jgi:hypothetical protein
MFGAAREDGHPQAASTRAGSGIGSLRRFRHRPQRVLPLATHKLFENGHAAFENDRKSRAAENAKDRGIEVLEEKLQRKNAVLSELLEEHLQLTKELGEP